MLVKNGNLYFGKDQNFLSKKNNLHKDEFFAKNCYFDNDKKNVVKTLMNFYQDRFLTKISG